MKRLQLRDVSLIILALVVAVLAVFAVRASLPLQSGPEPSDQYPLPATPEFPTATDDDRAALKDAAAKFRDAQGWLPSDEYPQQSWFDDVGVLTRDGRRVGVFGILLFEQYADLPADPGFVLCGEALDPLPGESLPGSVNGLYIALLDGRARPYQILPMTDWETLPQSRDLGRAGAGKCRHQGAAGTPGGARVLPALRPRRGRAAWTGRPLP